MQARSRPIIGTAIALFVALASTATTTTAQAEEEETYRLSITRTWDHTDLLVVIVPPLPYYAPHNDPKPIDTAALNANKNAVRTWQNAIDDHGSSELSGNVTFTVRVLGVDDLDPTTPIDILVTSGRVLISAFGGAAVMPQDPCLIANTPTTNSQGMYRIAIHEFGHCLGLGHPDDFQPDEDVMAYGTGVCVSNLDLLVLHESFAPAFGRTAANAVEILASDYEVYC